MHEASDSQLLRNEAATLRHTSQTLLKLAETLHLAAKNLESEANDIERQSKCAKITEARSRQLRRTCDVYNEKAWEERYSLEQSSTISAMRATNTLQQEKIIKTAIHSLVDLDLVDFDPSSKDVKHVGGEVLSQFSPGDVPLLICYLAAKMLMIPELMAESEQIEDIGQPEYQKHAVWAGPFSEAEYESVTEPATPEIREERLEMPDAGFVTRSGWMAINRRQHW